MRPLCLHIEQTNILNSVICFKCASYLSWKVSDSAQVSKEEMEEEGGSEGGNEKNMEDDEDDDVG